MTRLLNSYQKNDDDVIPDNETLILMTLTLLFTVDLSSRHTCICPLASSDTLKGRYTTTTTTTATTTTTTTTTTIYTATILSKSFIALFIGERMHLKHMEQYSFKLFCHKISISDRPPPTFFGMSKGNTRPQPFASVLTLFTQLVLIMKLTRPEFLQEQ